jgi:hypothetical protein
MSSAQPVSGDTPGLDSEDASRQNHRKHAATAASAAGTRAFSAQLVAFYFRAPVKAFFRTRVEYASLSCVADMPLLTASLFFCYSYMVFSLRPILSFANSSLIHSPT